MISQKNQILFDFFKLEGYNKFPCRILARRQQFERYRRRECVLSMIEVSHLRKTFRVAKRNAGFSQALKALFHREYEEIHALDGVSFSIGEGEMVGYIGPNGAGKSSTIKVLSGILTPDSGECLVDGQVPWKDRVNHVRQIGVVFGQRSQLWWDV